MPDICEIGKQDFIVMLTKHGLHHPLSASKRQDVPWRIGQTTELAIKLQINLSPTHLYPKI